MKYFIRLIFISLLVHSQVDAQVLINEVCTANDTLLRSEENDFPDWIELYNSGNSSVNLQGYQLTSLSDKPSVWTFPSVEIAAQGRLSLFASGKNRNRYFDHWEVAIRPFYIWRYFLGKDGTPPNNWYKPEFNDQAWASGPGGIGLSDGDDNTIIPYTPSYFMRHTFTLPDTSGIKQVGLYIDYDDSFVAYLNGVEVARSNIGAIGKTPAVTDMAYIEHEAKEATGGRGEFYYLDQVMVQKLLKPGANTLALVVNNYYDSPDLSCIPTLLLGIEGSTPRYFDVHANAIALHTGFTLPSVGSGLKLSDAKGKSLDVVQLDKLLPNHSYGRVQNGANTWKVMEKPSPNASNSATYAFQGYMPEPLVNLKGGFYKNAIQIKLELPIPGTIVYTLDGSEPTPASPVYTQAITLDSTRVLKARALSNNGRLTGPILTQTYFINQTHELPVISLSINSPDLYDYWKGIFALGPDPAPTFPYYGANFWQDWKKRCYLEMYESDGSLVLSQGSDVSTHGNWSKGFPAKSLRVYANDDYGSSIFNYQLFKDKTISRFKSFNIRNAGLDWNNAHMRDGMVNDYVRNLHVDIMDYRPCILYINGRYWGVYEIRERQDEEYIQENFNVPADNVEMVTFDGRVNNGDNRNFIALTDFASSTDLSNPQAYDSLCKILDIENVVDYHIIENYIANRDWMDEFVNNVRVWRSVSPLRKWRYALWDTDLSLGQGGSKSFQDMYDEVYVEHNNRHTRLINSLFKNAEFKRYFINRYADLLNTQLSSEAFNKHVQTTAAKIAPEMERHFNRWVSNNTYPQILAQAKSVNDWQDQINIVKQFLNERPGFARQYTISHFGLVKEQTITVEVTPKQAGSIQLNTLKLEAFPWSGIYFDGNPIDLKAIAHPGYVFSHWELSDAPSAPITEENLKSNPDQARTYRAVFTNIENGFWAYPNPVNDQLTIGYRIEEDDYVSLRMYNLLGKEVARINGNNVKQSAGLHTLTIDTQQFNISAGVYLLDFEYKGKRQLLKIIKTNPSN